MCDCIKKTLEQIGNFRKLKYPEEQFVDAQFKKIAYPLSDNGLKPAQLYAEVEIRTKRPRKDGSFSEKPQKHTVNFFGNYCMFCGEAIHNQTEPVN